MIGEITRLTSESVSIRQFNQRIILEEYDAYMTYEENYKRCWGARMKLKFAVHEMT